jgi:DNA polymerase-4/protein ImuB
MSVACVLISHLLVKIELLRQPALKGKTVLIVEQSGTRKTVIDRSPSVNEIEVGMPLEKALTLRPDAALIEADMPLYRERWNSVLDSLEQRSPVVEDVGLGLAYVDLRGLEKLYGGEAGIIKAILDSVSQIYRPQVGVAGGKFPAYVAALQAESLGAIRAPEDAAAFLAEMPIMHLPTSWKIKERLLDFGLDLMGSIARLPFNTMQGEFGKEGARLWQLANGLDDTPLMSRQHEETFVREVAFATPTVSLSAILVVLESLLARAFTGSLRGRFARVALLEGRADNGSTWSKRIGFREPVGSCDRAMFVLRSRLDNLALPGPLETLSLTLSGINGESGRQESLFPEVRHLARLDDSIRELRFRLGQQPPIYRVREVEPWSRIPERRRALVAYDP